MNDHARIRELLAAAPVFDLSPAERAEVDAHLARCASCRAFADGLRQDALTLAALPRVDAPEAVRRAVLGRVRRRHSAAWYPAAAAAVVMLFVAPLALAAILFGGLRIPGLSFCPGCSSAASPAPAASEPGAEGTGAPPLLPPTAWNQVTIELGGGSVPTSLASMAAGRSSVVAVGTSCGSSSGGCFASVAASPNGRSWSLVPPGPALEVEPLANGAISGMRDVVAGGPGFVAVGVSGSASTSVGAVWTSDDGRDWRRVPDAEVFRDSWINSVVALEEGTLVAAGGRLVDGSVVASFWTSIDGETWQRSEGGSDLEAGVGPVALDRESPGAQDVVVDRDIGVVAVGLVCDSPSGPCRGAAWRSAAGVSWSRTPDPDPFAGGQPWVAIASGGLVTAAGVDSDAPAIWITKDASRWLPIEMEGARPGGSLLAMIQIGDRQWAAGLGPAGPAGVWSSELGGTWRLTSSAQLEGATVRALLPIGDVVVAAGQRDGQGSLWIGGGAGGP